MKLRDTRLWVLLLTIAFFALWCASIAVARAAPPQEPAAMPEEATMGAPAAFIGIAGWALVGLGGLSVLLAAILGEKGRRRHRKRRPAYRADRYKSTVTIVPGGLRSGGKPVIRTVYGLRRDQALREKEHRRSA